MEEEKIVKAAKEAEKKTDFGELVHSPISRGVNSAYGIGFLEGAEWHREQMLKEAVEGEVIEDLHGQRYVKSEAVDGTKFKFGDKVKILIIPGKED